jgi:virulence-associated protein E
MAAMRTARPQQNANGHTAARKRANGSRGHKAAKTEVGNPAGSAARYARVTAIELIDVLSEEKDDQPGLLGRVAYHFGGLVNRGYYDRSEAADLLRAACVRNGLVFRVGEGVVQEDIAEGLTEGIKAAAEEAANGAAEAETSARDGWRQTDDGFDRTPNGTIAKSEGNIRHALATSGIKLSYDAFARQRIIRGLPSYGPDLTDAAIDALWIRFEREYRVRFSRQHFNAVVRVEAHANSFHPVRDYLAGITWDGKARIDRWLVTYAGADDTDINHQFSRLVLIAAVRRARHPGSKFDAMLVLEGSEGRNKSTLFETLASPEWFLDDAPPNSDARETMERLRGKWIIEAADLAAVKRTDVERLKAFLSRTKDTSTLKFERETTTALRECIFVGTTNSSEYLQSKTGNPPVLASQDPQDRSECSQP